MHDSSRSRSYLDRRPPEIYPTSATPLSAASTQTHFRPNCKKEFEYRRGRLPLKTGATRYPRKQSQKSPEVDEGLPYRAVCKTGSTGDNIRIVLLDHPPGKG